MRQRTIVLILALILTVAACGDDDASNGGSATAAPTGGTQATGVATTAGAADITAFTAERGDPTKMWVSDFPGGRLATIDLVTSSCTVTNVGLSAEFVAFGLGGVWITDGQAQQLVFADPATGEVLGRRDVGGWPSDIALSDTSIWVAIPDTNTVLEIDPTTGTILEEMPFDEPPSAIALSSYGVGTWTGPLYYNDLDAGVEWMRDMVGSIYDLQFYNGLLWALVVFFGGDDHAATGSEIWVIDPPTNEATLFAEVPDYLIGILVDDYGVWANSLEQSEVALWNQPFPTRGPATSDPYWATAESPSRWRPGGKDIFDVHHPTGWATRVERDNLDHNWGAQRPAAPPPSLWDQPGTSHYDVRDMCDAPKFGSADVAAATDAEYEAARIATPPPWDSDPEPTGAPGATDPFFKSCSTHFAGDGAISADGEMTNAASDTEVTFSVIAPDGVSYLLGTTKVNDNGVYTFDEVQPPIDRPFTVEVAAAGAMCSTPVE